MPGALPPAPQPPLASPGVPAPAGGRVAGAPGAPGAALQVTLGYQFKQPDLLRAALIHRSYLHDVPEGTEQSNERLEFLGDAVLGFLVARWLYERYPDKPEGDLTILRGALVRLSQLSTWGTALDLGHYVYLSKGEETHGGRERATIIGRAMEALLGAIYLDGGLRAVDRVLRRFLATTSESSLAAVLTADYKSQLQREVQARFKGAPPQYRLVDTTGPAHEREFTVAAWAGEHLLGQGVGRSKQQAEQAAARTGLQTLESLTDDFPAPAAADTGEDHAHIE
ncbi:MAG TPA: ribonuclease III [Chloroflexia bacterium]|nr:ribonuclease III [Chloroflexia bacterium]